MNQFREVITFVFFIGYPRSGHSLLGACLDAHPNAVISHELDALALLKQGIGRTELFDEICKKSKSFFENGSEWSGYSYRIPGMWQGSYKTLEVIGDKRGGGSAKHLETNPELLDKVKELAMTYRMIHVVKNPFDCISTSIMTQEKLQEKTFLLEDIHRKVNEFFSRAKTISSIIKKESENVITLRYETLLKNPGTILSEVCTYLGLSIFDEYIEACSSIIWPSGRPSRLRSSIWDSSLIDLVQKQIDQYSFFEGYNFNSE